MQPRSEFFPSHLTGEMAKVVASYPWETHPLGPPENWPVSLKNAVVLLLECKLPMYVAWGPDYSQFYNDAYRQILGDKHPGALGNSARITWAEIWATIGPMWEEVMSGKAIGFDDYKLTIQRYDFPEDCYFNFSYSPVRDDEGRVAGVLVTFAETTQKVVSERRFRFLDELAQSTRNLSEPAEVMRTASSMLGNYLEVNRCAYAHVLEDQNTFDLIGDYNNGVSSIVGQYKFTDFGMKVSELMIANIPYVNENVDNNAITKDTDLSAYRLTQIQAVICVPLHKNGKFVAAMAVHQSFPRRWTNDEIELVTTVVDRCWESLERLRAENDKILLLDSERAARQEAEKANAVKDNFLSTLSHELRTPLTAITGWVHILRRKLSPDLGDLHRGVDVIERSTKSLTRLIDDLLEMSKIAAGKLRLDLEVLDVKTLVQTAHDLVYPRAHAAQVELTLEVDQVQAVLGDLARLQQVLSNVLTNALKFTPPGGTVAVRVYQVHTRVVISVADTGVGIRSEFLPHLFERFRQADDSITRKYGGLGLGLSIVHQLVELHGGTVTAESPGEGMGATFHINLPAHNSDADFETPFPECENPNLTNKLVLVVDDDEDSRELLKRVLEDCGAQVALAADAYSAIAFLERTIPDAICSDIGMPGLDGYGLVQWLRGRPPERGGRIPAIAMTAFARPQDRARSIKVGFDVHLSKPVDPGQVCAVISRLLASTVQLAPRR